MLVLELLDLGFHFDCDVLLDFSFIHSVTRNLGVKLPMSDGSEDQPSLVEFVTEVFASLLVTLFLRILLPESEELLIASLASPLLDPSVNNLVVAVSLWPGINSQFKLNVRLT